MLSDSQILVPIVALIAWTLVIMLWMFATRIPEIARAKMVLDPDAPRGVQMQLLSPSVRWKADNFNHLLEQPTLFYAVSLVLALLNQGDGINLMLAWSYVGLRIAHSLVQVLINKIEVRFFLFLLSSATLVWMTINTILILL